MIRTLFLLGAASAAAVIAVACSSQSGDELGNRGWGYPGPAQTTPGTVPTGTTPATTPTGTPTTNPQTNPQPQTGPGSNGSAAHQYFVNNVYSAIANCRNCHNTGVDGAPTMMQNDANTTYSELDARGLIQPNSLLLTHGTHDSGKAPALTSMQQQVMTTWLQMEGQERGSGGSGDVLLKVAQCMDRTQFENIGLQNLKTQPRQNENPDRCEGCNGAYCRMCHGDTGTGFYMTLGSKIDDATFDMTQQEPFITIYFGLNGMDPVASNAIKMKQTAVAAGPAYSHPMFTIPATVQTNLDKFVSDTVAKYKSGACGGAGPADAGTD